MALPRILLVEDDSALRRFVSLALEDKGIDLVQCEAVAPALAQLAQGEFALILTDLMMPGASGLDLLEQLQREPVLRGPARVAVLSAGLTGAVREQLARLEVWRLLSKPVSVGTLLACVDDALAGAPAAAPGAGGHHPPQDGDRQHAVQEYFEGNQTLFDAYRSACMDQFPHDLQEGDTASAAADLQALRRVAHSLKSVLLTLGFPALSAHARTLEDNSHTGLLVPCQAQWRILRAELRGVLQNG